MDPLYAATQQGQHFDWSTLGLDLTGQVHQGVEDSSGWIAPGVSHTDSAAFERSFASLEFAWPAASATFMEPTISSMSSPIPVIPSATASQPPSATSSEASPVNGEVNDPSSRKRKRERNTEAARRYRQRRQDQVEDLQSALEAMTKERDELKLKLARSEAEANLMRTIIGKKK